MTPESLDEYLAAFGEKVCMKGKSGGKMVAVSQLREYVRRAIAVAESRCNGPTVETSERAVAVPDMRQA